MKEELFQEVIKDSEHSSEETVLKPQSKNSECVLIDRSVLIIRNYSIILKSAQSAPKDQEFCWRKLEESPETTLGPHDKTQSVSEVFPEISLAVAGDFLKKLQRKTRDLLEKASRKPLLGLHAHLLGNTRTWPSLWTSWNVQTKNYWPCCDSEDQLWRLNLRA